MDMKVKGERRKAKGESGRACWVSGAAIAVTLLLLATVGVAAEKFAEGDAEQGHAAFAKLRCNSCHVVAGQPGSAPHPLPDLTNQPAEAVAALITEKSELAPEALFDDMLMSHAVAQMTPADLSHIVAYLRHPER